MLHLFVVHLATVRAESSVILEAVALGVRSFLRVQRRRALQATRSDLGLERPYQRILKQRAKPTNTILLSGWVDSVCKNRNGDGALLFDP